MTKQFLASILILVGIGMVVATGVQSATEGSVSATVTVQLVSVSVSDGSVDYGTMVLDITKDTITPDQTQTATNDGNVDVDLGIKSSDAASGGTPWNLAASRGSDEFTHEFSINAGTSWAAFNVDNTSYSTLASDVVSSGSQTFDLRIGTPTSSSDIVEHTVTVTVLATAS